MGKLSFQNQYRKSIEFVSKEDLLNIEKNYIPEKWKEVSDLKEDISMGNPVIECNYYDAEELKSLVASVNELLQIGARIKIYENKVEITLKKVKNLIEAIEGIAKDREKIDNLMFDEDTEK